MIKGVYKLMQVKHYLVIFILIVFVFVSIAKGQSGGEYRETFDSPSLEGWEIGSTVTIENGVIRIPTSDYAFKFSTFPSTDFTITARIEPDTELLIGYNVGNAGSYQLIIGPGYTALIRDEAGVPHELYEQPVEVWPNEWFVVDVRVVGNEHLISINGISFPSLFDENVLVPGGLLLHTMGPGASEIDELVIRQGNQQSSSASNSDHMWVRTVELVGKLG